MPDQTNAAYDPADQGGQQALVEQLLANPAFLETVRGLIDDSIASAAEDVPNCHMSACPPANEGFPGIRRYAVQPFASNPGDAATCHAPLIMPPDNSLHATFTGMTTPMPYMSTDGQIYMFPGTVNGVDVYGFCVDHALPAPIGSFGNISIDVALNGQTQATKLAVAFVIANVPRLPTDDAVEFFQMLGLPCADGFNGYDARVVGRYVIYALLGQLSGGLAGLQFIDRPGYPPIDPAKADCLKEACQILFEMALAYGNGTLDCGPGGGPGGGASGAAGGSGGANACCNSVCGSNYTCGGCGCAADKCTCNDPCGLRLGCQIGKIYCCNTSQAVTDMSDTYLVFVGCANDLRECCGRVVVGPFKLASSNRGTPDISLVPCNGCPGADIQLTDFCCNILAEPPAIGDEFYVAFRPPSCRYCFDLCATMETTSVAVYFFREAGNAAVQRQGLSFPRTDTRTTCIHICIDITPEPPPPGPEPWWEHILVNNNNNNNNNDSSNNDNNDNNSNLISNLVESLLTNLLSSNMMSGMLGNNMIGGGLGPGPPFPPGIGPWPPGPGPFPPGPGPFPPGPGPFPPGPFPPGPGPGPPGPCGGFSFPWKLFPPGTTPCPPVGCGGPNPCCCNKSPCCCPPPCPPCPNNCCCPCPPPCPPPCWCPPPVPPCPPPCPPWPCPCPEPCFLPYPYIPEPGLIIQPAIPTYQAVPMPVPCFCPPPVPAFQQPFMPPFQPFSQPYPPMPQPYPPFYSYAEDGGDPQPVQQVYNPVTVVVPPPDPPQPPVVIMPEADPWMQYGAPPMAFLQTMGMPFPSSAGPVFPPPQPAPQPFYPPVMEPMPLLLPEISSAPRPDLSAFEFENDGPSGLYDQFYRDWYGQ